jgi:hypothetical protein
MQEGVAILVKLPSSRRALLDELVTASRSVEIMVQLTVNTAIAVHRGVASVLPNMPAEGELRTALEAQRPQMLEGFAALMLASFAKTYASLPTPELAQYVTVLKSDAGSHFNDLVNRAVDAALVDASTEFGRSIPNLKDQPTK